MKIQWHTSKITNKLKEAEVKLKELISVRTTDKADEQSKFPKNCCEKKGCSSQKYAMHTSVQAQITNPRLAKDGKSSFR